MQGLSWTKDLLVKLGLCGTWPGSHWHCSVTPSHDTWDLTFLMQLNPQGHVSVLIGMGLLLILPSAWARRWEITHCSSGGWCYEHLGRVYETRGVCSYPWPAAAMAWRNRDAIQALAFKKGGGDRKICRQQMWKEKESSGTRKMVQLVQVQKEGGWRQGGGHWATLVSVLLKWLWGSLFSC